jgi:hypothetical protein
VFSAPPSSHNDAPHIDERAATRGRMATEGGDERGGMRRHRIAAIPAGPPAHQRDVGALAVGLEQQHPHFKASSQVSPGAFESVGSQSCGDRVFRLASFPLPSLSLVLFHTGNTEPVIKW